MAISSALGSSALLPAGLGFRNVLINGAMQVAQRSTSVASISTSAGVYHTVDRWKMWSSTAGTWTQTRSTDAPEGFGYSLKMQCTTANASLSAGSYLFFQQEIEGQNLQQFAKGTSSAKPMMLSFWVKAFQTGVYVVELYDNTNSRHVTLPYTVNVSGTWEYKTVQIPADATGTFVNSNASALAVGFWFVAGTTYTSGTANGLWGAEVTGKRAVGLNVNSASSTSNYFQFTGVQLEQNLQPTPFEQRPIGVELSLCQRYYWRMNADATTTRFGAGYCYASNQAITFIQFPQPMRSAPTALEQSGTASHYAVLNSSGGGVPCNAVPAISTGATHSASITWTTSGSLTAGNGTIAFANSTTNAFLAWSAEL
jgi:hypothetical protein